MGFVQVVKKQTSAIAQCTMAKKRMGLVYFVTSSQCFIRSCINNERLQNRSIFTLLAHSGRGSLKKGIPCKALPFSESLLLLQPKQYTNQASCKE